MCRRSSKALSVTASLINGSAMVSAKVCMRSEVSPSVSTAIPQNGNPVRRASASSSSFGQSMIVNSCCRSKKRNGEIGGHERSLHVYDNPFHEGQTGTLAIDIKIKSPEYARTLALRALLAGWSVGVARGFLHLDRRDLIGLPPRIFGYGR